MPRVVELAQKVRRLLEPQNEMTAIGIAQVLDINEEEAHEALSVMFRGRRFASPDPDAAPARRIRRRAADLISRGASHLGRFQTLLPPARRYMSRLRRIGRRRHPQSLIKLITPTEVLRGVARQDAPRGGCSRPLFPVG